MRNDAVQRAATGWLDRVVAIDRLLERLVSSVAEALAADRGTIYLCDPHTQELVSRAAHLPELTEIRLKPGQGVAGQVAASGELINVPTTHDDRRFFQGVDDATGYQTRSIIAAPIRDSEERVLGVLQLLNKKSGSFEREDGPILEALARQVGATLESTTLYRELKGEEAQVALTGRFHGIIGSCDAMLAVTRRAQRAARTDATVLIRGQSGCGKELFARALHENSERGEKPFVKVDCASLPESLVENELFGHEAGAYTDAQHATQGKFERAQGGTIFLDEIGELSPAAQARLLRVLQDRNFERVGGTEAIDVDLRVIAATHRDLEAMVEQGSFRHDLYYRLRVVELELPPLSERTEDLPALCAFFLDRAKRRYGREGVELSEAAHRAIATHHWPGNVRELEHRLESAVVVTEGLRIEPEDLALSQATRSSGRFLTLAEMEAAHMQEALRRADGNKSRAAELLGISRNTLARRLKELS